MVEILIAIFIFMIVLGALITANNLYFSGSSSNLKLVQATYLAEEGMEAARIIRDTNWTNLSALLNDIPYYLYFDTASSIWKATTTVSNIDFFNRTLELSAVNRDASGKIIVGSGTIDPNTRKVTISVSWNGQKGVITKSMSTYLTNIIEN